MELVKKNIHMNKCKCKSTLQLTLDDDFNVPDVKPDIERIIKEQGTVKITDVKAMNGKLLVKGVLSFNLIYLCTEDARPVYNISGEIPFDEVVNMDSTCADDGASVLWELEDLKAGVINSRKVSVNAIIRLNVSVDEIYDEETAISVEGPEEVQYINKKIDITGIAINKKDIFRIKDEVTLPGHKPDIAEILYYETDIRNVEVRLLADKFNIKGELPIFLLYACNNEDSPIEYYETEVPFSGTMDCAGCSEDMIEDVTFKMVSSSLNLKTDNDGENRELDLECILDMSIKVYEMEQPEILSDVYCTFKELTPVVEEVQYENLIIKNNSKFRFAERMRMSDKEPKLLQICHANGTVKVDEITVIENGLLVEGIVDINILYVCADDMRPFNCFRGAIPFSQTVEVKGINRTCEYDVRACLDSLSVMMLDSDEIEVKAGISLNAIVFDKLIQPIIKEIDVSDLDLDKLQAMPGIIGYIVKPKDTLWKIAKMFYTTVDTIKSINGLEDENIHPGDKLLIMKKVDAVF